MSVRKGWAAVKSRLAAFVTVIVLGGSMPACASMAPYWSSFASDVQTTAGSMATDMLPVLALLGGLALGERVIRFVLSVARG